jgi:hypothetical protein
MGMDSFIKHFFVLMLIPLSLSSLAFGMSGGGYMRTFEGWARNYRILMGRQVVIMTDNPSHDLVTAIQQLVPTVVVISAVEAIDFVDTQRQRPLIILIGSEVWRQNHYDRLSVYIAGGEDRVLPVLLQGQSAETSLPVFLRDYLAVDLIPETGAARLLAAEIARSIRTPSDKNASARAAQ